MNNILVPKLKFLIESPEFKQYENIVKIKKIEKL